MTLFELLKAVFLHIDAQEKAMLESHGLTLPRFYVLLHVHNHPNINSVDLTNLMLCTKGNISRITRGMEADGLIHKQEHPADGRSVQLMLTQKGDALLLKVFPEYEALVDKLMGAFKPDELKHYTQVVKHIENTLTPQGSKKDKKDGFTHPTLTLEVSDVEPKPEITGSLIH